MRLLAPDPENRLADMDKVLREMDAAADALGPGARIASAPPPPPPEVAAEEREVALAEAKRKQTAGWLVVLSVMLVFAVAALVLVVLAPGKPRLPDIAKLPAAPATPPQAPKSEPGPRPPLTRPD